MSDEQTMPIDRLDTELISAGEDMWMIEEVKRDDGPYVLYADHLAAIATITAERDNWHKLVIDHCEDDTEIRKIAKPFTDTEGDSYGVPSIVVIVEALVAQLKEQDDE